MKTSLREQYPDIAPPTINVFRQPIPEPRRDWCRKADSPSEEAIKRRGEDMTYMTSTASIRAMLPSTSISSRLPTPTWRRSMCKPRERRVEPASGGSDQDRRHHRKQQNAELLTFALYSPDKPFRPDRFNNYVEINVEPRLENVSAVKNATTVRFQLQYAPWLRPDKMAQYGLIPMTSPPCWRNRTSRRQPVHSGANHPTANEYTMKYRGRPPRRKSSANWSSSPLPGGDVLRLKGVADVELGDELQLFHRGERTSGCHDAHHQKTGSNA